MLEARDESSKEWRLSILEKLPVMRLAKEAQTILQAQTSMLEGQLQVLGGKVAGSELESQREIKDLWQIIAKKAREPQLREILSIFKVASTFYKRIISQKLSQELVNTQEPEQINVKTYTGPTE